MVEPHLKTGGEDLTSGIKRVVAERLDPGCVDTFKLLKVRRRHRWLIFQINEENTIVVERVGDREDDLAGFKAALPPTECRWCIYDYEFELSDGRKPSKLFFLCWTPHSSAPYQRMAYTSGKKNLRDALGGGLYDVLAQAPQEIEHAFGIDVDESDESDIDM